MNLFEAEKLAIERPPLIHIAAIDIMGQVIEIIKTNAFRFWIALIQPAKLRIIDRAAFPISVDKIEHRTANADNGWHVNCLVVSFIRSSALRDRMIKGVLCID